MNRRKNLPGKCVQAVTQILTKSADATKGNTVGRAHSTLSVSAVDYYLNLPVSNPPSPAISTVTLTPGRIRNIDQDMEALRASRQDNPFIQVSPTMRTRSTLLRLIFQQIIASRESLIDSLEEESDHANLMSKVTTSHCPVTHWRVVLGTIHWFRRRPPNSSRDARTHDTKPPADNMAQVAQF